MAASVDVADSRWRSRPFESTESSQDMLKPDTWPSHRALPAARLHLLVELFAAIILPAVLPMGLHHYGLASCRSSTCCSRTESTAVACVPETGLGSGSHHNPVSTVTAFVIMLCSSTPLTAMAAEMMVPHRSTATTRAIDLCKLAWSPLTVTA